jgi:hypothetical protein
MRPRFAYRIRLGTVRPPAGANDAHCEPDWVTCRPPAGANEFAAGKAQSPPARTRRHGGVRRPEHLRVRSRGVPDFTETRKDVDFLREAPRRNLLPRCSPAPTEGSRRHSRGAGFDARRLAPQRRNGGPSVARKRLCSFRIRATLPQEANTWNHDAGRRAIAQNQRGRSGGSRAGDAGPGC